MEEEKNERKKIKEKQDKKGRTKKRTRERLQYHPALCNTMELELYYDRELLEFLQCVKMNTLPREIDFLVIRKEKPGEIKSELGKMFRRCNIWEFKSYKDGLGVPVFHKTMSYADEYLSLHSEIGGIEDVTLSFLREAKPVKLIKWLKGQGYKEEPGPEWLLRFSRKWGPGIQIVITAHPQAPALLRALSHKAESDDIKKANAYIERLPEGEKHKARLIMELSYRINGDKRGGNDMGGFFETYVDPLEETIRKQNEQLEQKDELLEQKDDELERSRIRIAQLEAELAAARK
ncbi:MAG: hypothetical protein IKI75_00590 [Lachnospiraceae bacterium]|nr:hypothetical protein [Lachnospiraceae bacterium]